MNALAQLAARRLVRKLTESFGPTEGIYYAVCLPDGWHLLTCPFDNQDEPWSGGRHYSNHDEFWKGEVAEAVAEAWVLQRQRKQKFDSRQAKDRITMLKTQLKPHYACFPRGRVDRGHSIKYIIRNGLDLKFTTIGKSAVERAFEIQGRCAWEYDEHERCIADETANLHRLIPEITARWPAFGVVL